MLVTTWEDHYVEARGHCVVGTIHLTCQMLFKFSVLVTIRREVMDDLTGPLPRAVVVLPIRGP